MINKFPKKALGKWNRFNILEKGFIIYCICLSVIIFILPIFELQVGDKITIIYLINQYLYLLDIIFVFTLIFLILWNISFRFKRIIHILFGFKENDALVNFILLWSLSISFLSIQLIINFFNEKFSSTIKMSNGFYIISLMLIIGLIGNLFLALDISKNRKKSQIVNIHNPSHEGVEELKHIKGLFDN